MPPASETHLGPEALHPDFSPLPLRHSKDRVDSREQEVRDGERESESQQPRWPEQGTEEREGRGQD